MFHRCKYGKVEEGYQYCTKCGKAILAPVVKCQHVWVEKERMGMKIETCLTKHTFIRYIDRCSICGEIKITDTDDTDNS